MLWLIRAGAYALGGIIIWQFLDGSQPVVGRKLALAPDEALVFGVCAGLSNYTGFDVTLIRMAWTILACFRGAAVLLYILAFLLMP